MKRNKKGFTIVELVIVIAVIAILSAILIPTFVSLTQKAENARAITEVGDVYTSYLIADGEKAKTQENVIITRGTVDYTYTQAKGWEENAAVDEKKGDVLFDNGDNDKVAEEGEIVVYVYNKA